MNELVLFGHNNHKQLQMRVSGWQRVTYDRPILLDKVLLFQAFQSRVQSKKVLLLQTSWGTRVHYKMFLNIIYVANNQVCSSASKQYF